MCKCKWVYACICFSVSVSTCFSVYEYARISNPHIKNLMTTQQLCVCVWVCVSVNGQCMRMRVNVNGQCMCMCGSGSGCMCMYIRAPKCVCVYMDKCQCQCVLQPVYATCRVSVEARLFLLTIFVYRQLYTLDGYIVKNTRECHNRSTLGQSREEVKLKVCLRM